MNALVKEVLRRFDTTIEDIFKEAHRGKSEREIKELIWDCEQRDKIDEKVEDLCFAILKVEKE